MKMILRVIEKKTNLFIRDDFTYDEDIEFGLDVEPAQGLYAPKWDFDTSEWVEGATQEEIDKLTKPQPQEPTIEERLEQTEELLRNGLYEILQAIEDIKNQPELDESSVIDE